MGARISILANESEVKEAVSSGADVVVFDGLSAEEIKPLVEVTKRLSETVVIECSGMITPANVREYADAGAHLIRIEALTNAAPAMNISFRVQPF